MHFNFLEFIEIQLYEIWSNLGNMSLQLDVLLYLNLYNNYCTLNLFGEDVWSLPVSMSDRAVLHVSTLHAWPSRWQEPANHYGRREQWSDDE